MKKSKVYKDDNKTVDAEKLYSPADAFSLLHSFSKRKFDESVEVHFNLGIDPRHSDQQLRGTFVLPNGTANKKILVMLKVIPQKQLKQQVLILLELMSI